MIQCVSSGSARGQQAVTGRGCTAQYIDRHMPVHRGVRASAGPAQDRHRHAVTGRASPILTYYFSQTFSFK